MTVIKAYKDQSSYQDKLLVAVLRMHCSKTKTTLALEKLKNIALSTARSFTELGIELSLLTKEDNIFPETIN